MADVYTQGGSQAVVSVPSPYLLGNIIPSANELRPSNSLGLVQPIGFGTTTRRFVDETTETEEGQSQASDLAAIVAAVSNSSNYGETLRYDISGITGAVGPQGPPGATVINHGLPGGIGAGGTDAQSVVLSSNQQTFAYDGAGIIVAGQTITFVANTQNGSGNYTWAITSPIGGTSRAFTSGGGVGDSTATLSGSDFDGWGEADAEISVTRNGITDITDVYKIQDGTDVSVAFLTNENHSFPATNAGTVDAGDYAAGVTEIRAYIGTTQLNYHASDPSTYSLGTLVVTPTSKITITESTASSQRVLTPSAFDASTDTVIITIPINIRDSAGTVTTLTRILTYGKNKTGAAGAAGVDAFDDIDIPTPYDGFAEAFVDNSDDGTEDSAAGSVYWAAFKVKYKGTEYQVVSGTTALAYLYWDVTDPLVVTPTATRSVAIGIGKFMVGWNNSGTFTSAQFIPMVTAGFIDVVDLAALGITVVNADIGTAAIETANIKNLNVDGTKLGAKAAETAKIDDDATKIITSAYTAGSQGPVTTSAADFESAAHAGLGNAVVVTASFQAYNTNATLYCPFYFDLYYAGSKIGSDYFMVLNSSYHVFSMSVRVASPGSGTKTAYINCYRGAGGYSTTTYMYQSYLEVNEDLGK